MTILKNKNFPFIPDSYLINNNINDKKSYKARNILSSNIYSSNVFAQETPPTEVPTQFELPPGDIPAAPAEPGTIPQVVPEEVGYVSVGVFTASGALPVEDAVVTIYLIDENGEENVLYHLVTDANGQVPKVELPVSYNRLNPLESAKYFFTTYNLRVQAINYYTQNIQDIRVFPETTTNFQIELIPAAAGIGGRAPELTVVIPSSPIDASND